jgi:hypothetical protein
LASWKRNENFRAVQDREYESDFNDFNREVKKVMGDAWTKFKP